MTVKFKFSVEKKLKNLLKKTKINMEFYKFQIEPNQPSQSFNFLDDCDPYPDEIIEILEKGTFTILSPEQRMMGVLSLLELKQQKNNLCLIDVVSCWKTAPLLSEFSRKIAEHFGLD